EAAAFERHHARCAPRPGVVLAGAARHRASTVARTHNERRFHHGRINHDALRLVDQVLRNIVGNVHDLPDYRPAVFQPFFDFLLVVCGRRSGEPEENQRHDERLELSHVSLLDRFVPVTLGNSAGWELAAFTPACDPLAAPGSTGTSSW